MARLLSTSMLTSSIVGTYNLLGAQSSLYISSNFCILSVMPFVSVLYFSNNFLEIKYSSAYKSLLVFVVAKHSYILLQS